MIRSNRVLWKLIPRLRAAGVIGFDIETLMDCRTWCLAQIGLPTRTYIVDMLALDDFRPIAVLAEDADLVKIIHNAGFERGVLTKHGIGLENVFDTLRASRARYGKMPDGHNLGAVCRRELGIDLDKSWWSADWSARPLRRGMLNYAALDAEVLIDLHRIFSR